MMYSKWVSTPLSVRQQIAEQFGIAKTGTTHVVNNEVVSDGYDVHAVESALSTSAMQEHLGVKENDSAVLLDLLITKFEKGVTPIPEVPTKEVPEPKKVKEEAERAADAVVEEEKPKSTRKPKATT